MSSKRLTAHTARYRPLTAPLIAAVFACSGSGAPLPAKDKIGLLSNGPSATASPPLVPEESASTSSAAPSSTSSTSSAAPAPGACRATAASSASAGSAPPDVAIANSSAPVVSIPHLDVVYWATPQLVVDKMLELAQTKSTDIVYDLGCGDARSLITAAERYGARGYGFDLDPRRVAEARENARLRGVEHLVTIEQADIFTLDLSPADVVFLYLLPRFNVRLMPQLQKLRPGSRIVSHDFDMPGATPKKILRTPGPADGPPSGNSASKMQIHKLYLWEVPWKSDSRRIDDGIL